MRSTSLANCTRSAMREVAQALSLTFTRDTLLSSCTIPHSFVMLAPKVSNAADVFNDHVASCLGAIHSRTTAARVRPCQLPLAMHAIGSRCRFHSCYARQRHPMRRAPGRHRVKLQALPQMVTRVESHTCGMRQQTLAITAHADEVRPILRRSLYRLPATQVTLPLLLSRLRARASLRCLGRLSFRGRQVRPPCRVSHHPFLESPERSHANQSPSGSIHLRAIAPRAPQAAANSWRGQQPRLCIGGAGHRHRKLE
jgi:hypothetical protein